MKRRNPHADVTAFIIAATDAGLDVEVSHRVVGSSDAISLTLKVPPAPPVAGEPWDTYSTFAGSATLWVRGPYASDRRAMISLNGVAIDVADELGWDVSPWDTPIALGWDGNRPAERDRLLSLAREYQAKRRTALEAFHNKTSTKGVYR